MIQSNRRSRSVVSKLFLSFVTVWIHILICQHKVDASEIKITTSGTIEGRLILPQTASSPPKAPSAKATTFPELNSTLITLNNGEYSTYSTTNDGSFTFHNIPPGVHVLDVHNTYYHFSQIKIQLLPENNMVPNCIEYTYAGSTKHATPHPLLLSAHATYSYFESRPSFSPFRIFKNPMVLMMIVSVGFMVIMPYMMDGLDDEQKEQMKKQMEMQSDPTKMLSQMWGEISGKPSDDVGGKKSLKKGNKTRLKRE